MNTTRVNSVGEIVIYGVGDVVFLMDTGRNRVVRVSIESVEPDHKTWAESVPKVCYNLKDRAGNGFARYADDVFPSARDAARHGVDVWTSLMKRDPDDEQRCNRRIKILSRQVSNLENGSNALKKLKLKRKNS